jgi:hypothetical protein
MQRNVFSTTIAGLLADLALPFWCAVVATLPIGVACWWFALSQRLVLKKAALLDSQSLHG